MPLEVRIVVIFGEEVARSGLVVGGGGRELLAGGGGGSAF